MLDLTEQEELAECVRKYPCLYDKTSNHTKVKQLLEMRGQKLTKALEMRQICSNLKFRSTNLLSRMVFGLE